MQVRRCWTVYLEPREEAVFDLESLLAGGDGLRRERKWLALAPHLGREVELDAAAIDLLGRLSPEQWTDSAGLEGQASALRRLLAAGLAFRRQGRHSVWRRRDEAFRRVHWQPLAALLHAFTRWRNVDAVQSTKDSGTETALELRQRLGKPPAEAESRAPAHERIVLPRSAAGEFDRLLARRTTCRNFDAAPLSYPLFAQLLHRVFAAQAQALVTEDTVLLKKSSPSGGGLHPVEAYLVVRNVEGIAPGLYHYHATAHALEPLPGPDLPLRDWAMRAVAQQHWLADAPVLVVLAARFERSFWKYRNHAKSYRVVVLEAGHLSQTLYLAATDAGLGAFITGAVNEVEIERALGLDPAADGVLAVCGFGVRGQEMSTFELDPAGEVWAACDPVAGE